MKRFKMPNAPYSKRYHNNMNKKIEIACIQFCPALGDVKKTIKTLSPLIRKSCNADIVVLPELANSGYNFKNSEHAFELSEQPEKSEFVNYLIEKCIKNNFYIVSGFNERDGNKIYNSALLVDKEGIKGKYRKIHLFGKEKNYFEPGNLPLEVFGISGVKIGMLICFDWMFPELWRILSLKGADIICHPSNLVLPGFAQKAMPGHALVNRIFTVTANRIGTEKDLTFTGNSVIADPMGEIIASASSTEEDVLIADIDISFARNKMVTPENHAFNDRRPEFYKDLLQKF